MGSKSSRWIIGVLVVAVLLWRLAVYWQPDSVPVQIYQVTRGAVEATVANTRTGTLEACRRAKISPITSGRVEQIRVKEGQRVEAGHGLLSFWEPDL